MEVSETALEGVLLIKPARFGDARGFFSETWNRKRLSDIGIEADFVQDNHSMSAETGTLRGLHYQSPPHAQGKLVRCGRGTLLDVVVDARRGSPTYGRWIAEELSYDNGAQLWIPAGLLHGFVTREPMTEIIYKCTAYYAPEADGAVHWNSCGVDWGLTRDPILSEKDRVAPRWEDFDSPFEWSDA